MAMVVKNNMSAVRTLNTLNSNTNALQKSLQKVSSGMKINSAQDDASGYAISERMRVRIRSLDQANQNTQNDSSLMKTAEGAVGNTVEILRALKEKAINAANDSNTEEDRQTIQKEINQFIDQIDDNALVQFNGKYLVDGSKNNATIASKTILLNQSLHSDTIETDALTTLSNRAGDSLGIQTTDKWQVSWVENGNITFTSGVVGDKSLEDILNAAWKVEGGLTDAEGNVITDDEGNAITHFGQVKATTKAGLISPAESLEESTTYDKLGATTLDGSDVLPPAKVKTIFDNYYKENTPSTAPTSGTPFTVSFADLKLYADSEGGTTFTLSDGTTTVENTEAAISYDGTTATVTHLGADVDIYGTEYVNTTDKALATTITLPASTSFINMATDTSDFATDLNTLIPAGASTSLPDSSGLTEATTMSATAMLSEILAEDADGNTLTDVPKYYFSADGTDTTEDILVTRTRTYGSSGSKDTDRVTFSLATGSSRTSVPTTKLYAYNPDYVETDGGTGFDNVPDKFGKAVYTPDGTPGIAVAASVAGVDKQISGLTISILDQDGNVKKAANAALDQFKQYQRAENKTGDMSLNFHIGSEANVAIKVGLGDMRSQALGLKGSDGTRINVYNKENANSAINVIENALAKALDQQTTIGAIEARLEYTSTNLTTSSENVQAAESTIRDADMAKEMTNYTKSNVLLQAAQAMLAQANQNSSAVLSLLQ